MAQKLDVDKTLQAIKNRYGREKFDLRDFMVNRILTSMNPTKEDVAKKKAEATEIVDKWLKEHA